MAEVVGVVASGVGIGTLAAQIAGKIIKLKSCWDQVKDAPEDIRDLVEELEVLNHTLVQIEDHQHQYLKSRHIVFPAFSSTSLQHCKQAAARLNELIDNLSEDIEHKSKVKQKWASAKVALKKEKIDKYRAKLERTITLLVLSRQEYQSAIMELQLTKLSEISITLPIAAANEPPQEDSLVHTRDITPINQYWSFSSLLGAVRYSRRIYSRIRRNHLDDGGREEQREEILAEYRAPPWLINRVWRIQALRAVSGWTFSPRSYNIIPNTSIVFEYLENHNISGIQELFSQRQASPFDCDEHGLSLLHLAVDYRSLPACKLLIEHGADVDFRTSRGATPTDWIVSGVNRSGAVDRVTNRLDLMRLLLRESDDPPYLANYDGPKEGFSFFQQSTDPVYYQRPIEERLQVAYYMAFSPVFTTALLQTVLGDNIDAAQASSLVDRYGTTVLHIIARAIGRQTARVKSHQRSTQKDPPFEAVEAMDSAKELVDNWKIYLKSLLAYKPDLHKIGARRRTPFLEFVDELVFYINTDSDEFYLPLYDWLDPLQFSGVDMNEYGRKELELHEQGLTSWRGIVRIRSARMGWFFITEFEYGPLPSNWYVRISFYQEDSDVGSPEKIPGGWVDDDEEDSGQEDDADNDLKDDDNDKKAEPKKDSVREQQC